MADTEKDLVSRTIRFIEQQQEMYGDFSIDFEQILPTEVKYTSIEQTVEFTPTKAIEQTAEVQAEPIIELTESELLNQCSTLEELKELCNKSETLRTDLEGSNLVFGVGNTHADLIIIGEAPGVTEDEQGEPFLGEAGQLLDKILAAINFNRDDIYITNILKHRTPDSRDSTAEERSASLPFLLKQIELINPKLILCLGKVSANTLLNTDDSLKNLRAKFHEFSGGQLLATYHPAALLRNQQWKRPTWEDVQLLRKRYDELNGKP